jgi:hypothetical protein
MTFTPIGAETQQKSKKCNIAKCNKYYSDKIYKSEIIENSNETKECNGCENINYNPHFFIFKNDEWKEVNSLNDAYKLAELDSGQFSEKCNKSSCNAFYKSKIYNSEIFQNADENSAECINCPRISFDIQQEITKNNIPTFHFTAKDALQAILNK